MPEIKVPADVERIVDVLQFINETMCEAGAEGKQSNNINIAVEEVFVNIANYAYLSGDGYVIISVDITADIITIEFIDSGKPYNPLLKDDPDITLSAEEREIGGLGVFLVKNIMDNVSYRYEGGRNILTISKKLDS